MNTATISFFTEPLRKIPRSRFSSTGSPDIYTYMDINKLVVDLGKVVVQPGAGLLTKHPDSTGGLNSKTIPEGGHIPLS